MSEIDQELAARTEAENQQLGSLVEQLRRDLNQAREGWRIENERGNELMEKLRVMATLATTEYLDRVGQEMAEMRLELDEARRLLRLINTYVPTGEYGRVWIAAHFEEYPEKYRPALGLTINENEIARVFRRDKKTMIWPDPEVITGDKNE